MALAPIVLFVYDRPVHTLKTLQALNDNELAEQSRLYIFADGPKANSTEFDKRKIHEVRELIKSRQWCGWVEIKESQENRGLAESIKQGVTEIVNKHGKIIVLEDDIVTKPNFLKYMNDALDFYQNEDRVMHIGSFVPLTTLFRKLPETWFSRFMSCWGWATWSSSWECAIWDTEFLNNEIRKGNRLFQFNLEGTLDFHTHLERNLDGSLNTWAIKWFASIFLNNGLCLYPSHSLTKNIGFDGSGENCDVLDIKESQGGHDFIRVDNIKLEESRIGKSYLKRYYTYGSDSSLRKQLKTAYVQLRYKLIKKIKGIE